MMYLPKISPTEQVFIKTWLKDFHKWNNVPKIIAYQTYCQESSDPIERFAFTNFLHLLSIGTTNFRLNGKETPTYRQRVIYHLTSEQINNLSAIPPKHRSFTIPEPSQPAKQMGRPKKVSTGIDLSRIKLTEL